jgi:dephospho-CoA kinase
VRRSFIVGLTGGIGSGKSAVSKRFAQRGIAVTDTDVVSRVIVEPGEPALDAIAHHFGAGILDNQGRLDRVALRKRVFADPSERRWIEGLLNPLIGQRMNEELGQSASPYALLVNPVLIETGQYRMCQRVLVVDVPKALQVARTTARDGNTEAQVNAIMAAQTDRQTRLDHAHDVIVNDQDLEHLDSEVQRLHDSYLDLATQTQHQ